MSRIAQRDTKPEMVVRRLIHSLGYRFRLQRRELPGTPDLVLPRFRKVVFVHGCFWHRHPGCKLASFPKTKIDFWRDKFSRNIERDNRKEAELIALGWDVLTVWECQTRKPEALRVRLRDWLSDSINCNNSNN
ncbi:DNA mismatch endonuclease Vsr [Phyllobacterium sp. A18/5-2]|jgi:DNA mismatch endonuclease (patch repair protein)|uniref:Very short patch repair endonuclease n=2 Tax=Phyllobacterium sophorae TaxID=1520277 RepID=A0A2P7BIM7_9HYPH|nr:DNA mismatch endonuclease Vsr [Phyllobacterium sp. A18/5-2]PSH66288.1 very short patch repair endonuclease [Phyllobacterium sophorae]UXN65949.1 DNA mismatch endonuclease Vsr [Phyllobacterium sp. A18/5-2]